MRSFLSRKNVAIIALIILLSPILFRQNAFGLDPAKTLSQYVHSNWGTENGLPQTSIQSIIQTRDGYIWVATQEGFGQI